MGAGVGSAVSVCSVGEVCIRFLTDEEIARMRDVAYNGYFLRWTTRTGKQAQSGPWFLKQAKYFLFILNTGLRKGEATALKYSDIDFEQKQ